MEASSPPSTCPGTVTVRRNPHRKARPTPSTTVSVQNPTHSTNVSQISSFPIDEILSIHVPHRSSSSASSSSSENLKVFLRIKPLISPKIGDKTSRYLRDKNVWPQNPVKKNSGKEKTIISKRSESCVTVTDHNSVTLSPPLALQISKRIKTEVYQGFSYIFSADSSQAEVYEQMVSPLVEDFLRGKSGMLAALGPSGSGKTHTIFGSPRVPGMVPIALKRIFKETRSFYLSIFEIRTEGGKGEKMLDLLPDGAELCMQQSTIKGLQEIAISHAAQAESLIASAMLKRATATTNANSQSSRSQCIINLRCAANELSGDDEDHAIGAVLTIVDLAGAEREKRTGNQGTRLLESNFINNTSMVFGLCLRSLLEHQKYPKKPLQKHFKNSLLTRYLRDYLEGKKKMTLILTVKSGEEDYLDTSYLLRQASPYMKIKFDNVVDSSNLVCNKRHFPSLSHKEQLKRVKLSGPEVRSIEEAKSIQEEQHLPEKVGTKLKDLDAVGLAQTERINLITQNFAKATWRVLKQFNKKLKVAESKIQSLTEQLHDEKLRRLELEKELEDLKYSCTCRDSLVLNIPAKEATKFGSGTKIEAHKASKIIELEMNVAVDYLNCETSECSRTPRKDRYVLSQKNVDVHPSNFEASECNRTLSYSSTHRQNRDVLSKIDVDVSLNNKASNCNTTPKIYNSTPRKDQPVLSQFKINVDEYSLNCEGSESKINSRTYNFTAGEDQDVRSQINDDFNSPSAPTSVCNTVCKQCDSPPREQDGFSQNGTESKTDTVQCRETTSEIIYSNDDELNECDYQSTKDFVVSSLQSLAMVCIDTRSSTEFSQSPCGEEESPKSPSSSRKVPPTPECATGNVPKSETNHHTFQKPLNVQKPKRRLLPASSILLRDITALDVEDDIEKQKVNRNGNKLAGNEAKRTQGSKSLLRLLKHNLKL